MHVLQETTSRATTPTASLARGRITKEALAHLAAACALRASMATLGETFGTRAADAAAVQVGNIAQSVDGVLAVGAQLGSGLMEALGAATHALLAATRPAADAL